jgi:hypothetical protein
VHEVKSEPNPRGTIWKHFIIGEMPPVSTKVFKHYNNIQG